jgi:transposase
MIEKEKIPQDIHFLQSMVQSQNELITTLKESLQAQTASNLQLQQTIANLELMVTNLQQQIETLLRQLYGKKSEKKPKDKADPPTTSNNNSTKNPLKNNKKGRRKLSHKLPRQRVEHDLPQRERICKDCKGPLHKLGEEVSEQYEFIPAKLIVIEHVRSKYVCRPCGGNIIVAPMPNQPIEKGLAGPGLLAEVLINKYEDALPLYRQEQRWARLGTELSRSTLCAWVKACANLLEPLVRRMQETSLLKSLKIHSDDTPVPVQIKGKGKTHTGRLWVYVGGGGHAPPCTIYDYSPTRSQEAPLQFLKNYKGYLQADAYAGFDVLYISGDIIECTCWSHARRKFFEITEAVKKPSLADDALVFIDDLLPYNWQVLQ